MAEEDVNEVVCTILRMVETGNAEDVELFMQPEDVHYQGQFPDSRGLISDAIFPEQQPPRLVRHPGAGNLHIRIVVKQIRQS